FNRQFYRVLQLSHSEWTKAIDLWVNNPLMKERLIAIASDKVLNQIILLASVNFFKTSIVFIDAIEKNKTVFSSGSKEWFNHLTEKKGRLVLGAFKGEQNNQQAIIEQLLANLKQEFHSKQTVLFRF